MSSVVISGDTSGAITLAVPAVAGTNTVTIAAQTGTLNAAGPAFLAVAAAAQPLTSNTDTKVTFGSETFDTNNNFASSTFTPTVAGYYQLNTTIRFNNNVNTQYVVYWYKNGASIGIAHQTNVTQGAGYIVTATTIVYMNGTTDYAEIYANTTGTTPTIGSTSGNVNNNYFSGCLVRGA